MNFLVTSLPTNLTIMRFIGNSNNYLLGTLLGTPTITRKDNRKKKTSKIPGGGYYGKNAFLIQLKWVSWLPHHFMQEQQSLPDQITIQPFDRITPPEPLQWFSTIKCNSNRFPTPIQCVLQPSEEKDQKGNSRGVCELLRHHFLRNGCKQFCSAARLIVLLWENNNLFASQPEISHELIIIITREIRGG